MAKLSWIIFFDIFASAMLWLTGIQPIAFSAIATTLGGATPYPISNITNNSQVQTLTPPSTVNPSAPGFLFNILVSIGITAAVSTGLASVLPSILGSGSFSIIYLIPAAIIINLFFLLFTPIGTIVNTLLVDPFLWVVGIILFTFFMAMNILGIIDFIRGGEA